MTITNGNLHQDIGELRSEVRNLKSDVSTMKEDVGELHDALMKAHGFKYAGLLGLGAAGAIGGAMVKAGEWVGFLPK